MTVGGLGTEAFLAQPPFSAAPPRGAWLNPARRGRYWLTGLSEHRPTASGPLSLSSPAHASISGQRGSSESPTLWSAASAGIMAVIASFRSSVRPGSHVTCQPSIQDQQFGGWEHASYQRAS